MNDFTMRHLDFRRLPGSLLALAVCLAGAAAARADNLDTALVNNGAALFDKLHEKGYKNVGVLHFRVQVGNQKENFNTGTISDSLAFRLENALIIWNDTEHPIGIIRDASAKAASHKVGGWHKSEAERQKLFKIADYPLAWGGKTVKPDAFLTGVVKVDSEMKKADVFVEAFSAKNPKLERLHRFTVNTDRSLLRDLGQTFMVSRRGLTAAGRDAQAVADARKRDANQAVDETVSPDNVHGLGIQVLYNGQPQTIQRDGTSGGEWRVNPPSPGQKVDIVLTHNGQINQTLACVLKVNGRSTWQQQEQESKLCQMWLMRPGQVDKHEGFYLQLEGRNLIPFDVLDSEQSSRREAEFGNKVGLLELDVFESRPSVPGSPGEGEPLTISARGVSPRSLKLEPAKTLKDLQTRLMAAGNVRMKVAKNATGSGVLKRGGLMVASEMEPVAGGNISVRTFPDATHVGGITIRYYDPSKMTISGN